MRNAVERTAVFRLRAEALSEIRRTLDLHTDGDLAEYIGMHRSAVFRVIHGVARPGPKFVAAVVSAFDVRIDDLFEVVDEDQGATT